MEKIKKNGNLMNNWFNEDTWDLATLKTQGFLQLH